MAIYRGTGGSSTTTDETTINAVNQKAAEAATSASNAASSASSAATSASNAGSSATSANTSASTATTAATQASASKDAAALSATNAAASELAAENAKTAAEAAETNAILYGNMANTAASDAADSQAFAEAARDTAETYATQVENNKDAAATSAAAALVSETNAAASETAAASSESNAASSEIAAAASAIAADASANDAATSEANAAASEAGVAADAATATTAAANALTSETNAAASEANAAASETNAATSESNAASSASSAATSATASASSAADSLASANAAGLSAANAAALLDNFDDRYLGPKSAAPATDNDGDPLIVGALYFDTTTGKMNVFTASGWLETGQAILALMEKFYFTATEGQTVFTGADDNANTLSIVIGSELVTLNGVVIEAGTDYTAASGSITLASGATAGDELNVISFNNFQLADAVSRTLGGTFEDDITVNGDVTATAFFGDGSSLTGIDAFPDQTGNSGRFLTTNGTTASWGVVDTTNGDTAYSWGDHSLEGYLTSYTETDPVFTAWDKSTGISITESQISDFGTYLTPAYTGNVDITGTATMDGLTVADAVGTTGSLSTLQNTSSPVAGNSSYIDFKLKNNFSGDNVDVQIGAIKANAGNEESAFVVKTTEGTGVPLERIRVNYNGDISFYEDTGTTAKFFWDASAESLGIGTSSPSASLSVDKTTANQHRALDLENTSITYSMYIDQDNTGTNSWSLFDTTNSQTALRYLPSSSGYWQFYTNDTERMRIDSSGNLLVGQSSTVTPGLSNTTTGLSLTNNGYIFASKDSDTAAWFNRNTSDGTIISLRKDGTAVGSIGTGSGYLTVGSGDTGLLFNDDTNRIQPWNLTANTSADAAIDIGLSSQRFKDLHLSGTANVNTVDLGNWTVTESGGVLYFATSGVNKMKLDASGNLTVTGEVTAYGTI